MADDPKTVTLVGHCGPDSSFLRMAVTSALPGSHVTMADTDADLDARIREGTDLLLFNRVLEVGFDDPDGVSLLRRVREKHPGVPAIMVSNFEATQRDAEAAGASPGFGKNAIGSDLVKHRLRYAVGLKA